MAGTGIRCAFCGRDLLTLEEVRTCCRERREDVVVMNEGTLEVLRSSRVAEIDAQVAAAIERARERLRIAIERRLLRPE